MRWIIYVEPQPRQKEGLTRKLREICVFAWRLFDGMRAWAIGEHGWFTYARAVRVAMVNLSRFRVVHRS